jgi:serine/threonine protein kinase
MSSFKNYTIIKSLGKGGMAEVFLAEDIRFKTKVAIKVLNHEFSSNSNISQRFIAEARNLFRMSHPNIVRVTDLIEEDGRKAFVMEYIEGNNLRDEVEKLKGLSPEVIRAWMSQMLSALGYCHSEGLVHRDIKPSNFMLTGRGQIKLLDFGIAKNTENRSEYTQTGTSQMMGTPLYMSPEQILETKNVDFRSDIYSLGVVLWQLVTGKKPYDSQTLSAFQIQLKIVNERLAFTGSMFDEIIQKCTAKDPKDRFQNCDMVEQSLNKFVNGPSRGAKEKTHTLDLTKNPIKIALIVATVAILGWMLGGPIGALIILVSAYVSRKYWICLIKEKIRK